MKLLTQEEKRVFLLHMGGMDYAAIGKKLHVSQSTIGTRMNRIYDKLGAENVAQATMIALRVNLFTQRELDEVLPHPKAFLMLSLFSKGKSNEEIATITEHPLSTVKNYLGQVLRVLGVHSRKDALLRAREKGYIAA